MREPSEYEQLTAELTAGFRQLGGSRGLVLLGSTADSGRRDRWSDHDFFAIVNDDFDVQGRAELAWLPSPNRVLLVAREGEIGFAVLYDDGHLLEFAVATLGELRDAGVERHRVQFGDAGVDDFVRIAHQRAQSTPSSVDPVNEARLVFVKLLVGFGRAQRGERVVAGQFVRTWAVGHFLRAVRARITPLGIGRDPLDPARRFDADYPEISRRLDHVLAQPIELAAVGVAELTRETLEPGWSAFPSGAADLVARVANPGSPRPAV
jgi:hypothetical protein